MWFLYLTVILVFFLFVFAIYYNTLFLWILFCSGIGLLLLYGLIKQAVKSALQEYDKEKELTSGQK